MGGGGEEGGRALTTRVRSLEDNDHVLFVFICLHPSSHGQATHTRAGLSDEGSGARVAELERERRRACAEVQGQTEAERKEVIPGTDWGVRHRTSSFSPLEAKRQQHNKGATRGSAQGGREKKSP